MLKRLLNGIACLLLFSISAFFLVIVAYLVSSAYALVACVFGYGAIRFGDEGNPPVRIRMHATVVPREI